MTPSNRAAERNRRRSQDEARRGEEPGDRQRRRRDRAAFEAARGAPIAVELTGGHDWILLYAGDRAALEASLHAASESLASPGTLWIAYPKGTSRTQSDLTRDAGWDSIRDEDLRWLSLVAIDDRWSAFSLRHNKPGESRQDFR